MSKEAMKLALDALGEIEWSNNSQWQSDRAKVAITALREALASQGEALASEAIEQKSGIKQVIELYDSPDQPSQQEPVVWMYVNKSTHETKFQKHMRDFVDHSLWSEVPLYGEPLANHELQCVCGAVWLGDELVHLPDKRPPAQRNPLTDEQLRVIENKINPTMRWRSSDEEGITLYPIEYYELVRAIEAAHGIKGDA